MNVFEAAASRYSCRAFLPTPIAEIDSSRHHRTCGARPFGRQHAAVAGLRLSRQAH